MTHTANIMIVDDSGSMRMILKHTLRSAGYEVTEAGNGNEALKIAQNGQFDLVITDINMPVMNGLELISKLRALKKYRLTPILTLTTVKSIEDKEKIRLAGATGWICKPFTPEKLLEALNKLSSCSNELTAVP